MWTEGIIMKYDAIIYNSSSQFHISEWNTWRKLDFSGSSQKLLWAYITLCAIGLVYVHDLLKKTEFNEFCITLQLNLRLFFNFKEFVLIYSDTIFEFSETQAKLMAHACVIRLFLHCRLLPEQT